MRESFIFLFLTASFLTLKKVTSNSKKTNLALLATLSGSLLLTKNYLYLLFVIAILLTLIIGGVRKKSLNNVQIKIAATILLPLIFFPSSASTILSSARETVKVNLLDPPTPLPSPSKSSTADTSLPQPSSSSIALVKTRGQTLHDLNVQINNISLLS